MSVLDGEPRTTVREGRSPYWLLAVVAAGVFFAADDQTSVVTVLPPIIEDLELSVAHFERIAWIVNGYLLGYTVAMPLMARVADVYGHARIYMLALVVFAVGSALVALSPNLPWLVAARALQAVGGGAVVPIAMAIVAGTLPPRQRALGIGVMAAASELGGIIGPLWGATIEALWSWRGLFWLNVPMVLPLIIAIRYLATDEGRPRRRLEYGGGILLTLALTALTVALTNANGDTGERRLALTAGAAAIVFALWFIRHERAAPDPIVQLSLLRSRITAGANLTNLLVGGGLIIALVNVPLIANLLWDKTPLEGGLYLMRLTIALALGALAGGWLSGPLGFTRTTALGLAFASGGFLLMAAWGEAPAQPLLTGSLVLAGAGLGLVIAPLGTAALNAAPTSQRALASSLVTVSRTIGMTAGLALLASQGLARFTERAALIPLQDDAYRAHADAALSATFQETFVVAAIVMALAILPALFLGRGRDEDLSPEERYRGAFWPL